MKTLRITLFIIGNVLFLGQLARDLHHLAWGVETSVFDEFRPARSKVRSEQSFEVLLADYRKVRAETEAIEVSKNEGELEQAKRDNKDLYESLTELRSELAEREQKSRELRDTWVYSGYGIFLILIGFFSFCRRYRWAGIALSISGFAVLEYWASPPIFSGAVVEFRSLLWSKTALTIIALGLLYASARSIVLADPSDPEAGPEKNK
jgi:hypothetical protein